MNSLPLVTVMIPVYNTQAFLEKCLGSVYTQSYPHLQVVIVNDASPDNSKSLVDELIARYDASERTLFIDCEQNRGLAAARMEGLKHAKGEYLLWLDSDDYWDNPTVVAEWVAVAMDTGAKLVLSDYYADYSKKIVKYRVPRIGTGRELAHAILRGSSPGFMCNKLIERQHFLQHAGSWVVGQNVFEDVGVTVPLCYQSSTVAYCSRPSFHYVQYNENSYLKRINVNVMEQAIAVIQRVEQFLLHKQGDEIYRPSIEAAYLNYKLMLFEKAPVSDYKLIRSINKGFISSLPYVNRSTYDKLFYRLCSIPQLAIIAWIMGRIKQGAKALLRD